ncbi:hypothetical protein SAMN04487974_103414 [Pelagibacterium luteolum]|uniref:Uncharacterized protein n=2 Tax=Pelagibacterium luteolum TaxID=440168 RepID=A0A1G7V1T9_9HYPH|nr:hypothetical protein SAMN04487974_103414 [Pelagibacterium luteolum]
MNVFQTREELHRELALASTQQAVDRWLKHSEPNIETLAQNCFERNTARSFRFKKLDITDVQPTAVFRRWAVPYLTGNAPTILGFTKPYQVRELVHDASSTLQSAFYRDTRERYEMDYGRAAKVVNLALKHLICLAHVSPARRSALFEILDIPLDKYTLGMLRPLLPNGLLPRNPSMGDVKTRANYISIQKAIRQLCNPEFSPMHYEVYAYNIGSAQAAKAKAAKKAAAAGTTTSTAGAISSSVKI